MFKKAASFIFLFSCLVFATHAQKNLKEAFVVFNAGDTARGFIDYKEWTKAPSLISFTTDKNSPLKRLGVNDLSYFDVIGLEQYKQYTVRISLDATTLSSLGEKDTSSETKTVFLKVLVKGKNVTLYAYNDDLKKRFYLQQQGDTVPVELLNSMYMLNGQEVEEKQYQPALRSAALKYLPADKNILPEIYSAGYYTNAITNICFTLNGTDRAHIANASTATQPAIRFFVGAGINQGALKVTGGTYGGINSSPFYSPVVDAGIDWFVNPAVGRTILRAQLHVTGYKTDASVPNNYRTDPEQLYFTFKQTNIALTPQILYNLYNQKSLKWFVSAGVGLNFSSYPTNQEKDIVLSTSSLESVNNSYVTGLKKFWLNGSFSTGVDVDRFEFAFVYLPKNSITQTIDYGVDNSSLQLRVNFFIVK